MGEILTNHRIAPLMINPVNGNNSPTGIPPFEWEANGLANVEKNNSFDLVFYDETFNNFLTLKNVSFSIGSGGVMSNTPSKMTWESILKGANVNKKKVYWFYWCIKATQTDTPLTGPYISEKRYITITCSDKYDSGNWVDVGTAKICEQFKKTCIICGHTVVTSTKTEHSYSGCTDSTCNDCNYTRSAPGHSWRWEKINTNQYKATCRNCGKVVIVN